MGNSLDGHLGYGIIVTEQGEEPPWYDGDLLGFDEYWGFKVLGIKREDFSDSSAFYAACREAFTACPLKEQLSGTDSCLTYALIVSDSYRSVEWNWEGIDIPDVQPNWDDQLRTALEKLGFPPRQPSWLLGCSYF